eukprot:5292044-Prymnesium_polylepis.1
MCQNLGQGQAGRAWRVCCETFAALRCLGRGVTFAALAQLLVRVWVPDLGLALRVRPGMALTSGADCSAPGISPCPFGGHGPREAG